MPGEVCLVVSLLREEVEACSLDLNRPIKLNKKELHIGSEKKSPRYIPLSKRQDRPSAALWLLKNYSKLEDRQIAKLVGSTKKTVSLIKNNNYWNSSNLTPKDPVVSNLCTQNDIKKALDKIEKKIKKKERQIAREAKKLKNNQNEIA